MEERPKRTDYAGRIGDAIQPYAERATAAAARYMKRGIKNMKREVRRDRLTQVTRGQSR